MLCNIQHVFDIQVGVVRCTQDTQITAGVSCDRMAMEYIPDEYCVMLLTLGTCNSRAVLLQANTHYVILIDVIKTQSVSTTGAAFL
jgi:hypothetical protein